LVLATENRLHIAQIAQYPYFDASLGWDLLSEHGRRIRNRNDLSPQTQRDFTYRTIIVVSHE